MTNNTLILSAVLLANIVPNYMNSAYAQSPAVTVRETLSDAAITAKIKALYATSILVKDSGVSVTTINKVVVLSGEVPTTTQYEQAIILADSIDGIKHINVDNLKVKSSTTPLSDTYITAKVKGMFLKEKLFGTKQVEFWPVKVETVNSVVHISGHVDTSKQKSNLMMLAKKVKGVKYVDSRITVG